MNIDKLISELKKELPSELTIFEQHGKNFKKYYAISGHIKKHYFDLTISESLDSKINIELAHTTDRPLDLVAMIKNIEPDAKVWFYELIKKRTFE